MTSYRYPLAASTWDDREIAALQRVIASGRYTMGESVFEFERQFARYIGRRHAVMVNSGSSANLLMVAALFYAKNRDLTLRRGDEVVVPAISWSTTYTPLQQYGLRLRFVDVDLETLNFDLDRFKEAITDRTRLVMAVNLLGNPNDYTRLGEIIGGRNVVLLEDNCESLGAEFGGRKAGTFGVMSSFSFFYSHHMCTMEGGMVCTDEDELHQILLSLRAHGWTRELPKTNRICGEKSDDPFEESFRFILPGYNLRPLEMSGALGIEQLAKLPSLIAGRRRNGAAFQRAMAGHPELLIQKEIGQSSWFGFSLVARPESKLKRADLLKRLTALGFESRPIVAGNFAAKELISYFDVAPAAPLPNAEHVDRCGLFVGNHHYPADEAIAELAKL